MILLVRCALAAALVLVLAGCGKGSADPGPHPGGTLRLALRDSFSTLDPAFAWDPALTPYLRLLYEGLVAFDDSGHVRPAAAERWEWSEDGRALRFTLRPNLRYASGAPVVAADFAHGLARLFRTGALRSPGAPQFAALEGALRAGARGAPALGVEAPDARTLVLRLAWRDPALLEKLAQPRYAIPVPAAADSVAGAAYGARPETNGPYALAAGTRNNVVFVRNPGFAAGHAPARDATPAERAAHAAEAGWPDTIVVATNLPARRALLGLESGRVDILSPLPPEYRERLVRAPKLAFVSGALSPPLVWHLALNAELAPLARRDARRAMARGINRLRLSEELGPSVEPWRSFTSEETGTNSAPGYDPEDAKLWLQSAKYFAGVRVPVTVARGSAEARACDALATGAARASIQFDPQPVSRAAWTRAAVERRGARATILPFVAPAHDALDGLAALLLNRGLGSGWGGNWAWYRPSPDFDSLLVRGLREPEALDRSAVASRLGELLESDLPVVPLAQVELEAVHRPEWAGARIHPRYGLDPAACWLRGAPRRP
jgi:ABC-type transport system substrate-binding protein